MKVFYTEELKIFSALRKVGLVPDSIYDVGSSHGVWSLDVSRVFPRARFFLFEPLFDFKLGYRKYVKRLDKRRNFRLFKIALSDSDGETKIFSNVAGYGASILPIQAVGSLTENFTVPIRRLESIINEQKLPTPDILKMDVQGAELKVLQGAGTLLAQSQVVQAEVWFRRGYGPQTPLFNEIIEFLGAFDFCLFELCSPYYSPERELAAADAFFIKASLLSKLQLPRRITNSKTQAEGQGYRHQ